MEFEVVNEDLAFPEGPVWMKDGSIVLVEIARGCVSRITPDGKRSVLCEMGGGPNGAAVGPDGALWICNNGGFKYHQMDGLLVPGGVPHNYTGGRIERLDLATGRVECVLDSVGGYPLKGPNDLVFDKEGNLYFTDLGKSYPRHSDFGGLYFLKNGESEAVELDYHRTTPNGVGLSPDEKTVYMADTIEGRVWAYDLEAPGAVKPADRFHKGRVLATLPDLQLLDSLAVTASGNVTVATIHNGGITTFTPDGETSHIDFPDYYVTNICFGGEDMQDAWITLSGTGKLIKCRWPEPGLKLNFYA